jgi:hypothetical protein
MLAPIALYPDQLVSQILMASTFPLQIVQAALDNPSNAALKGDALVTALQPINWDPSVKSITAFPVIVTWDACRQPMARPCPEARARCLERSSRSV